MIIRYLGPMFMAGLLFSMTIFWMGPISQAIMDQFWLKPNVTQIIGGSQTPISYQGTIVQENVLASSDILPVYGSSEFSAVSDFHPSHLFEGKPSGFTPFLVGRGGTQDIIHALNMAALGDSLKNKKITVILSAQWFTPEGISPQYFKQNFSSLHAYRMLFSTSLSEQTKHQLIERLLAFPTAFDEEPTLQALLKSSILAGPAPNLQLVSEVRGRVEMAALEVNDALKTVRFIQQYNLVDVARNVTTTASALPTWPVLKDKATEQGKAATLNNKFGILDTYYSEYVQPKLAENRNSAITAILHPSPEYQDLELLLQILQEKKAKPMFVIVPVNGLWYDFIGFPAGERKAYYARIETMVRDKGFQVANFEDHEYDRYFLQDVMHLGWKGWVYVDESLDQFYHEGT